jgi:thiosulfate/3-mercaptopyruvate sulfurtransferase
MAHQILLSAQELHAKQKSTDCLIVDCRFDLNDPDKRHQDYLKGHIPGSVYAHLDNDLSSPVTASSGRHPLPDADKFAVFLGRSGWHPGLTLVAYDDVGGAIAARLWWLMKYFGQNCAAMLDGGISAWEAAGYEVEDGHVSSNLMPLEEFSARDELVMSSEEIVKGLAGHEMILVDARAQERFIGEIEPIDAVAGHIPGSVNYPYDRNLDSSGLFNTCGDIRNGLLALAGDHESNELVHMCGSGVTACHNIFAAELAGMKDSKLYVGSWSEWIRDSSRPVDP